MRRSWFSLRRLYAIIWKEFIQMMRDRMTFGMVIGIPLVQLVLFGYAINSNPKHLPTAIVSADHSIFTRAFEQGLKNTDYFNIIEDHQTDKEATEQLIGGKLMFVINIPPNFTEDLVKGLQPEILVTGDATDPAATGRALSAVAAMSKTVFDPYLVGELSHLKSNKEPVRVIQHARYNPDAVTRYSIVPALMGVILTMTLVIITSLSMTREKERGTIETLLATPVRPIEVLLGKLIPYILIGYVQILLVIVLSDILFNIPFIGSISLLLLLSFPFVAANLSVGIMFSSLAKNQLQAIEGAFFFFLPSILLSGFMFPFYGMPRWAQYIGSVLPLTHFVRIIRGIMLKGTTLTQVMPDVWPLWAFAIVVLIIGTIMYRQTLD